MVHGNALRRSTDGQADEGSDAALYRLTDEELLKLATREARAELCRRYESLIVARGRKIFRDDLQLAEDYAQEVFVEVMETEEEIRSFKAYVLGYIPKTIKRRILQRQRGHGKSKKYLERPTDTGLVQDDLADSTTSDRALMVEEERKREIEWLREGLAELEKLNPNHRRALWLYEAKGIGLQAIAAEMGASYAAVKSWVHRGRQFMMNFRRKFIRNRKPRLGDR